MGNIPEVNYHYAGSMCPACVGNIPTHKKTSIFFAGSNSFYIIKMAKFLQELYNTSYTGRKHASYTFKVHAK